MIAFWRSRSTSTASSRGESAGAALSVFVVCGERNVPLVTEFTPGLIDVIESGRPPTWRLGAEVLPGAGHKPPESLAHGLRFVFKLAVAQSVGVRRDRH